MMLQMWLPWEIVGNYVFCGPCLYVAGVVRDYTTCTRKYEPIRLKVVLMDVR